MVGRNNKEILSVQVSPQHWPFSHRVVLAVFIVPSQKHTGLFGQKNWKPSLSTIMTETDDITAQTGHAHQACPTLLKLRIFIVCDVLRA